MVDGQRFGVDMEVDKAADEIFLGHIRHVRVYPIGGLRVYIHRDHIAYIAAQSDVPPASTA